MTALNRQKGKGIAVNVSSLWLQPVVLTFLVALTGVLGPRTGFADDDAALQAGIVQVDITPEKPVKMSGYAGRKQLSEGVHDPLSARVVAFQSGPAKLVLVSTDLIGFYDTYEPIRDAICEQCNLQPDQLFLSGIHTHSGPTPTFSPSAHPNNQEYTEQLKVKLVDAVGQALSNTSPVRLGIGRGYSPVGVNRREKQASGSIRLGRNPYGPTDKEVLVLKLVRQDGAPVGAVFDYATHATSLGPKNLQISGDVLGIAAQFVEQILGPDVIAPPFAGASGNIDPWFRVRPSFETEKGWVPEPVLLGTMLGEEVVHVYRDIQAVTSEGVIKSELVTLQLPAKQKEGESNSPTKSINVTVARLGDTALVGLGCELLTEIGMAIKEESPFENTFVITHCNGKAGYLPPADLYEEGGYEVERSGFGPAAAKLLVQKTTELLKRLQ